MRHTYNDAQTRIDENFNESPTASWHHVDLGLTYRMQQMRFALELNNLTDELYHQHMSYLRNPYSSGAKVYEPGRTITLNVLLDSGL